MDRDLSAGVHFLVRPDDHGNAPRGDIGLSENQAYPESLLVLVGLLLLLLFVSWAAPRYPVDLPPKVMSMNSLWSSRSDWKACFGWREDQMLLRFGVVVRPVRSAHPRYVNFLWPFWKVLDLTAEVRGSNWLPSVSY